MIAIFINNETEREIEVDTTYEYRNYKRDYSYKLSNIEFRNLEDLEAFCDEVSIDTTCYDISREIDKSQYVVEDMVLDFIKNGGGVGDDIEMIALYSKWELDDHIDWDSYEFTTIYQYMYEYMFGSEGEALKYSLDIKYGKGEISDPKVVMDMYEMFDGEVLYNSGKFDETILIEVGDVININQGYYNMDLYQYQGLINDYGEYFKDIEYVKETIKEQIIDQVENDFSEVLEIYEDIEMFITMEEIFKIKFKGDREYMINYIRLLNDNQSDKFLEKVLNKMDEKELMNKAIEETLAA